MEEDNNFLGRWLTNDLSDKEKLEFEKSKDYLAYKDIINATNNFERPKFDLDKSFEEQKKLNEIYKESPKRKVIKMQPWLYGAAAVLLMFLGLNFFVFTDFEVQTTIAETETFNLPDGSKVVLNAESSISYDKNNFKEKRILKLKGEAFFKVSKGSRFSVQTENGTIAVLGTQFNVYDREETFQVNCFEGKVQVDALTVSKIITGGQGLKMENGNLLDITPVSNSNSEPSWVKGKSSFSNVPLRQVIEELKRQYNIKIIAKDINMDRQYSGFFVHNNLQKALKTSFEPMNISFTFVTSTTIEVTNK